MLIAPVDDAAAASEEDGADAPPEVDDDAIREGDGSAADGVKVVLIGVCAAFIL